MDKTSLKQLQEAIEKNNNIGIVVGKNPNQDDMAAALSLYLSLTETGKQVSIAMPEEPTVELSSLVGINKVKTSLGGASGDLVVSFPYQEGEIDKVSYTLENNFLNIVVKAGQKGLSFSERDIKYTRPSGGVGILFVVGTPRLSDLGRLFDPADLKDTMVVNIDNKPDNQGFGDILMVSPKMSSVSEITTNLLLSLGFKINVDIAQNLMNGIAFATENFQSPKASYLAFETAGVLMRSGAQRPAGRMQREERVQFNPGQTEEPEDLRPRWQTKNEPQERIQRPEPLVQSQSRVQRVQPTQPQQRVGPIQPEPEQQIEDDQTPPDDWLTPKIYKGSTNF